NYAKVVADIVKSLGGKPFLTDCNTLYVGRRKNALEHMDSAYENGFSPMSTGCQIIIADGLKGTDETLVDIDGDLVKQAKIGTAIMDSDIFISLSHFKGHEEAGFGGALKNIGMGCGSRAGKMEMHSDGKPKTDKTKCVGCKGCEAICAHNAISFDENRKASIDVDKCVGCGRCIGACNFNAIAPIWNSANDDMNRKIAEYSYAVIKDKPSFHISLVIDVSPFCDCHWENDTAIIPDVGMFASFDPVALDVACADACNKQKPLENSLLGENLRKGGECCGDHFHATSPATNWRSCVEHAQKLGLGNMEYELIEVK
ncbi:MAG: DUF362 domain-containing protein, partial [Oscillospiraceae bacterium]